MSITVGIIYGFIIATFVFIIGFATFFVIDFMYKAKNNRTIRIKNWTAGKPYVEEYFAQLIKHNELGWVYFIPRLKKENRHYVQCFGSEREYPMNQKNRFFVPVTYFNGTYSPEQYDPYLEETRDTIVFDESSGNYIKKKITISSFLVKPVKSSVRQFNLSQDVQIKDEFGEKQGFWDKHGATILSFGIALLIIGASIIVFILLLQAGQDASATLASNGEVSDGLSRIMNILEGGEQP